MRIVLASNNSGKLKELKNLFAHNDVTLTPQKDLNVPEIEETGLTFVENAILKARNACQHTNLPAIADDSGLEVDALKGAPGIYSARYAGEVCTTKNYCDRLLNDLKDTPDDARTARYRCVLVFLRHTHDPSPVIAEGTFEGRIAHSPIGDNGFGYDPVFFLEQFNQTLAQLSPEIKSEIGHRGKAMRALLKKLNQERIVPSKQN